MYRIFIPIFYLLWRLFPQRVRERLSRYINGFHRRVAIEIPESDVVVFASDTGHQEKFQKLFSSIPVRLLVEQDIRPFSYSLLTTCLNESNSVIAWLESVCAQTLIPTEIIIVDGGSTDGTVQTIERWKTERRCSDSPEIILHSEGPLSISEGRNRAASLAKSAYLFFTDMGCVVDRRWAELLARAFSTQRDLDVVMGWYEVAAVTDFQKNFEFLTIPHLEHLDPKTFLPSGRSVAMTKAIFTKVGGYPESLKRAGEDSLFDYNVKAAGAQLAFVPEAFVTWVAPQTWRQSFWTIFNYARGDAEGGTLFWRHYVQLLSNWAKLIAEAIILIVLLSVTNAQSAALLIALVLISIATTVRAVINLFRPRRLANTACVSAILAKGVVSIGQASGFLSGLFTLKSRSRLAQPPTNDYSAESPKKTLQPR